MILLSWGLAGFWRLMSVFALITWVITVLAGLFLLAIWLIEYDPDFQRAAATRLPVPVISSHATLAVCGLIVWVTYLITGEDQFAYATLAILAGVVILGVTMAVRWVKVYRTTASPAKRAKALAVPARRPTLVTSGARSRLRARPKCYVIAQSANDRATGCGPVRTCWCRLSGIFPLAVVHRPRACSRSRPWCSCC